ncbi:MAG TPA: carbohydrate kinase family protein [Gaiellaceae bacterium]|nr:carbohydrate kinase family protein [Gaiellaceae bacterium]
MRPLGVVGLVSLDRVDGGLPRLGGAPFYAAKALRLLGRPGVIATKIAAEDSGRGLHALGLPVHSRPAARTISFRIENDGDRRSIELEEPGEPWTPDDVRRWVGEALRGSDWVHAGALTRADFPAETLALLARGRGLSFDGQGLVRPAEKGPVRADGDYDPDVLRHVDVLKLSEEEAEALGLGLDDRSLASLGVREIVVTLGRRGAVVFADGLAEHVPTKPMAARDPTGSGDEFMAAYLTYRRLRHGPVSAARLAGEAVRALLAA